MFAEANQSITLQPPQWLNPLEEDRGRVHQWAGDVQGRPQASSMTED